MDTSRTEIITGADGVAKLSAAEVYIFGAGGVGGYALEAVARAGIGSIKLFDFDTVSTSNVNRQLLATNSTIGIAKTRAAAVRIMDINPDCRLQTFEEKLAAENILSLADENIKYAIDAIDDIPAKVQLIRILKSQGACFVSSMGAGMRTDPTKTLIGDISETRVCPLARRIRKELKAAGIERGVPCVFSVEQPATRRSDSNGVGSVSYMPGIFGLFAAGFIIQNILRN